MACLNINVSSNPKFGVVLTCTGSIQEGAGKIVNQHIDARNLRIAFDLAGIELINSCGLAEWSLVVNRLAENHSVCFMKLSEPVVDLMNTTGAMFRRVMIMSVLMSLGATMKFACTSAVDIASVPSRLPDMDICI